MEMYEHIAISCATWPLEQQRIERPDMDRLSVVRKAYQGAVCMSSVAIGL